MATIVRGSIPAEELALNHTLDALEGAEVDCERIVRSGDEAIMPLLWVRHDDREAVDEALCSDPTVDDVECLTALDGEYLYRMEWIDHVSLLLEMLTNGQATVLDAYGRKRRWQVRVLYPDRDHLSATHAFANEEGLTFDIESIREMEGEPAGRFGLTETQYDALVMASKRGYFAVPRETSLEELAEDFDVTHQALSEQIRRGTDALVEDALLIGADSEAE